MRKQFTKIVRGQEYVAVSLLYFIEVGRKDGPGNGCITASFTYLRLGELSVGAVHVSHSSFDALSLNVGCSRV